MKSMAYMNAKILKAWTARGLLMAALACCAAYGVRAQEGGNDEARLRAYEANLLSADPSAARTFLEDAALIDRLKLSAPRKAAGLVAKARALCDLEALLAKPWRDEQEPELSRSLALRIDFNTPLEKAGIGAAPEQLLPWMAKYGKYSVRKTELVKRAIRQFEVVFSSGGSAAPEVKANWEKTTIRERNNFLAEKAFRVLERMINEEPRTDRAFQDEVRRNERFKYLDPAGRGRYERYLTQLAAAETVKAGLPAGRLEGIRNQPIEQQMYLLGDLFDKSDVHGAVSLERKLDGARASRPGETISFQNNRLLSDMLRTALPAEIKDTAAGDKVVFYYNSGAKLDIAIESCRNCYAKYEPSTGRIILDSDMIQQYLRVNNITTEELLKDQAQLAALAKYVSPMFVHEASHQIQHAWADEAGLYKPYTQEDEIESNSLEALYTAEKLRNDVKFRDLFAGMRRASVYADQRLKLSQRFNKGPGDFSENVRRLYYAGLPSFDAASAQILSAVSSELERRETLGAEERREIEKNGASLKDVLKLTLPELTGSVAGIKTQFLKKIQGDLLDKAVYADRYEGIAAWSGTMLNNIRGAKPVKPSVVPAL
jgi:hypothetical protein